MTLNIEENKLIAKFDGYKTKEGYDDEFYDARGFYIGNASRMEYDTSWDWLMEVIKKCKRIKSNAEYGDFGSPTISLRIQLLYEDIETNMLELDIDLTYKAVLKFIEEYNKIVPE